MTMTSGCNPSSPCLTTDFTFRAGESKFLNIHICTRDSSGRPISMDLSPYVVANTTVAVASNGANLPQAVITVGSTTDFSASGSFLVAISNGAYQTVAYTGKTGTTFTGGTGGAGLLFTGGIVQATPGPKIELIIPGVSINTNKQLATIVGNPKDGNITLKFTTQMSNLAGDGPIVGWLTASNGDALSFQTNTNIRKLG